MDVKDSMKFIRLLSFIVMSTMYCTSIPSEFDTRIRVIEGIETCEAACEHLRQLYDKGDKSCKIYVSDVTDGEGTLYTCETFCRYQMLNSVDMAPKCILKNVKRCDRDMWKFCRL